MDLEEITIQEEIIKLGEIIRGYLKIPPFNWHFDFETSGYERKKPYAMCNNETNTINVYMKNLIEDKVSKLNIYAIVVHEIVHFLHPDHGHEFEKTWTEIWLRYISEHRF
ncbi:MAG: hypothetical protein ACE5K4_09765 [Candidatus Hydrothermarchaeota archaeon]